MIQCIIFDCDGTLVDSEYICNFALKLKLKELGIEESATVMMDEFRGGKLATILDTLSERHNIIFSDGFVSSYRALVAELSERDLLPCEGVIDTLNTLNLPMCVASSGPISKIQKSLSVTNLSSYFKDNIFSSYQIDSWKPAPELFLHAAKEMGFKPSECAVVEDSIIGITAAKAASMKAVLYDPNQVHNSVEGVQIINHMRELSRVVT
jgi:HAD superfamily hydrolase (TIGR01509 family)